MKSKNNNSKATRKEWLGLAVIAIPCMLYSMDFTVLYLAAPRLSADLQPSSTQFLWIMDIYGFLIAGSLITMGTLGDRIGRRKLLFIGAAIFGFVSVLAAYSNSSEMFIFSRALLGLSAATLAPSTLSLIRNMFADPKERTRAIGFWVASFSTGAVIGPLIGGILLTHFWWGSVFLINVPMMLLLLILGPFLLPEFRDPKAGKLDIVSALLSLISVLLIIYGMKRTAESGDFFAALLFVVPGFIVGWVFVQRQFRLDHPLIELHLFRSLTFSMALLMNILALFVNFGALFFIAQYLQLVLGLSPLQAGLWTMPGAMGFVLSSIVSPSIAKRVSPAFLVASGFLVAAAGLTVIALLGSQGLAAIVSGNVIFSIGITPVIILATDLVVSAAPPERAGSASALSETSAELGGALGVAVLGSVITAIYRGKLSNLNTIGIPSESIENAKDSLAEALKVAETLPLDLSTSLIESTRAAFSQGVQFSAGIAAFISISAAIIAAIMLKRRVTNSNEEEN